MLTQAKVASLRELVHVIALGPIDPGGHAGTQVVFICLCDNRRVVGTWSPDSAPDIRGSASVLPEDEALRQCTTSLLERSTMFVTESQVSGRVCRIRWELSPASSAIGMVTLRAA